MFPQEVDVINIALVLPVFSAAVVKATSVWVLCVFGNGGGIGGWLDGGGSGVRARVYICVYVHMSTIGVVFSAQPWWADVMLGSGPCLCSALAVAARKSVVI